MIRLARESRRTDIAEAAIRTLAAEGMRGLTHRAVDKAAGLPEGSTSYYFRTRSALLDAVSERFVERLKLQLRTWTGIPDGDLADQVTDLVISWATEDREAQIARYELVLESIRRPELRPGLVEARAQVQQAITERLAAVGLEVDDAYWYTAPIEGMLLYLVVRGEESSVSREQIAEAVRRVLALDHHT